MYHGLGDQNVGTDPTNSMRLFHALNGLGKTTALYLYPLEDHGPATRETLLRSVARWAGVARQVREESGAGGGEGQEVGARY